MTTRTQIRAEQALTAYTRRHKRNTVSAALGNNAGTVEHPTRDGWVYARLHGDGNQVVLAYCAASVPLVAGLVVTLERVERKAASFYEVAGIATNIVYPSSTLPGTPGAHASQHQRRDRALGGFDPLDVYTRALVNLRGRAQATPDMTVYVERGFYNISAVKLWAGGNSGAFTAPTDWGMWRFDLLYMGNDDALHIVAGTESGAFGGVLPDYPNAPASAVPICYVLLSTGQTTITEGEIDDARIPFSASLPASSTPINHDHSGDAGDGGTFDAANLTSGAAADNYVLTSDGVGGAAWEANAAGLGWFNVKSYGATGDGVTNDTVAVAAAIAALVAAGKGVLYFPAGVYNTTGGFTLSVPTTVIGDGSASYFDPTIEINAPTRILCSSQTANLFSVTAFGCSFYGMMLQNTFAGVPSAGAGITVSEGDECRFVDLFIYRFYVNLNIADGAEWKIDRCVFLEPITYGIKVVHSDFTGDFGDWCISNCTFFAGDTDSDAAIRYESGGGGKIINCKINGWYNNTPATAFDYGIDASMAVSTVNLLVSNCSFENIRVDLIRVANAVGELFHAIAITGCQFGTYTNPACTGHAINIDADALADISNVVISNCIFRTIDGLDDAIHLTNVERARLSNNVNHGFGTLVAATTCTDVINLDEIHAENELTNGGLDIWQRGAGAFTADGAYFADRWYLDEVGTDTLSISRSTTKKDDSQYSAEVVFVLGNGAGATFVGQAIKISDNYHHLLGKTVSFRISAKLSAGVASAITPVIGGDGTGSVAVVGGAHGNNTNWEDMDANGYVVPTDATVILFGVLFADSCTAYLDNAMAVIGGIAQPYRALNPAEELNRCWRYYETQGGDDVYEAFAMGQCISATAGFAMVPYHRKGGVPTVTGTAANTFYATDASGAVVACSAITGFNRPTPDSCTVEFSVAAGLVAGDATLFGANNSASTRIYIEWNP